MKRHQELACELRCGIFGDRDTDINAAYEYLLSVANASNNPPAVITAAHVLINTICNVLLAESEEL